MAIDQISSLSRATGRYVHREREGGHNLCLCPISGLCLLSCVFHLFSFAYLGHDDPGRERRKVFGLTRAPIIFGGHHRFGKTRANFCERENPHDCDPDLLIGLHQKPSGSKSHSFFPPERKFGQLSIDRIFVCVGRGHRPGSKEGGRKDSPAVPFPSLGPPTAGFSLLETFHNIVVTPQAEIEPRMMGEKILFVSFSRSFKTETSAFNWQR